MLKKIVLLIVLSFIAAQQAFANDMMLGTASISSANRATITLNDMLDVCSQRLEVLTAAGEIQLKKKSKEYANYFITLDQLYSWLIQETNKADKLREKAKSENKFKTVNERKKFESDLAWGIYISFERQSEGAVQAFKLKKVNLPRLEFKQDKTKETKSIWDQLLDFITSL